MLSKSFEKYVNSLKLKKYRAIHQRFIAEGGKIASEFISEGFSIEKILALPEWIETNHALLGAHIEKTVPISESMMKKLSSFSTPSPVLLVVEIPEQHTNEEKIRSSFSLALDGIQDPGNLGTIIRIADWFGISHVFCSTDCVDAWNVKSVQASMGSVLRLPILETDLSELFKKYPGVPRYGASLEGENLFNTNFSRNGFIVIGNEGSGISDPIQKLIQHKITIPRFGNAESLNAAVATGIVCAFLRKSIIN